MNLKIAKALLQREISRYICDDIENALNTRRPYAGYSERIIVEEMKAELTDIERLEPLGDIVEMSFEADSTTDILGAGDVHCNLGENIEYASQEWERFLNDPIRVNGYTAFCNVRFNMPWKNMMPNQKEKA